MLVTVLRDTVITFAKNRAGKATKPLREKGSAFVCETEKALAPIMLACV